jgi:solute carrier family 35 protein E1
LTAGDITACIPIGLFAMIAHGGSVLAMGVGAVSFAQIVKASEPVFAAVVGLLLPPVDLKPFLAYAMLIPIVGGVGLACVKEGKGIDINVEAFVYASIANAAAALKGKLGGSVTKALKADKSKNMDSANVYAVMNIISMLFTIPMVVVTELPTLKEEWNHAAAKHGAQAIITNIVLSGLFFYIYNEFAFAFTASVSTCCIDSRYSPSSFNLMPHLNQIYLNSGWCCNLVGSQHCQARYHYCCVRHSFQ